MRAKTLKCRNCGHRGPEALGHCEECGTPLRPSQQENAASARETNCMILLVGVGLVTGATVYLAPDMPMPGVIGMAMAFGLIGVPALAPLLGYVLYSLLHLPAPAAKP